MWRLLVFLSMVEEIAYLLLSPLWEPLGGCGDLPIHPERTI